MTVELSAVLLEPRYAEEIQEAIASGKKICQINRVIRRALNNPKTSHDELAALHVTLSAAIRGKEAYLARKNFPRPAKACRWIARGLGVDAYSKALHLQHKLNIRLGKLLPISQTVLEKCKKEGLTSREIDQLRHLNVPLRPQGKQAVLRKGTCENPRSIFIDGQNAYLLLNTKEDRAIATPGYTHRPKKVIDLRTGKEYILLSRSFDKREDYFFPKDLEKQRQHIAICQELSANSRYFAKLISHHLEPSHKRGKEHIVKGWMIFEFCELGSLQDFLDSNPRLKDEEAHQILVDVMQGINAMHRQGYSHNDIHLGNIALYREHGRIRAKIIDLQVAKPATVADCLGDTWKIVLRCLPPLFKHLSNYEQFARLYSRFEDAKDLKHLIKDYESALHDHHFTITPDGLVASAPRSLSLT